MPTPSRHNQLGTSATGTRWLKSCVRRLVLRGTPEPVRRGGLRWALFAGTV